MSISNNNSEFIKSRYDRLSRRATGFIYQDIDEAQIVLLSVLPHSAVMSKSLQFQEFILELIENTNKIFALGIGKASWQQISVLKDIIPIKSSLMIGKGAHKEETYFRHLVLFNQAVTNSDKQEHYLMLRSLRGSIKETVLHTKQYKDKS